jgi:hypothetical protein
MSLDSPIAEYSSACWDPCTEGEINVVYRVQTIAAPFTHHTKDCDWETVAQRKTIACLWALLESTTWNGLGKLYATG